MIRLCSKKKGFISIFWIAIIFLVSTAVMVTATYMFSNFASTPTDLLIRPFQGYYNAELGIVYVKYLLDNNLTSTTPNTTVTVTSTLQAQNEQVTVQIHRYPNNPGHEKDYDIIATTNTTHQMITSHYLNGIIDK